MPDALGQLAAAHMARKKKRYDPDNNPWDPAINGALLQTLRAGRYTHGVKSEPHRSAISRLGHLIDKVTDVGNSGGTRATTNEDYLRGRQRRRRKG